MGGLLDPACALQNVQCGTCGVLHAIPKTMHDTLAREGGFFYCPNGHSRGWGKGTLQADLERTRAELEAERDRKAAALARANKSEQALRSLEARTQREHKRAAAGVCPCCNRTFQQLARHMRAKHPEHGT